MKKYAYIILLIIIAVGVLLFFQSRSFPLPAGETEPFGEEQSDLTVEEEVGEVEELEGDSQENNILNNMDNKQSEREVLITDGVKHSIPLDEILSGGPGKDGIPSIDNPKFIPISEADFLESSDPGLGLTVNGESRFYPYKILVWHEIVNDSIAGEPVLVTYCPLCATGIVFDRRIDGEVQEFGVSGRLWQSNLLMYNRAKNEDEESLWSQVLGEAVLGTHTSKKLSIVRSDIVRFGDWKKAHPNTLVLSKDTGAFRNYGGDPYGDYYTSESVSFGATFNDTRLHPKALVHGI
ncbi:MAG: DUF3179 domain-containing protein, partial [Candidatus Paceibacterota bacterium]